jgi:hypothetical protein
MGEWAMTDLSDTFKAGVSLAIELQNTTRERDDLRKVNTELLEALSVLANSSQFDPGHTDSFDRKVACSRMRDMRRIARAAIARAEAQQ